MIPEKTNSKNGSGIVTAIILLLLLMGGVWITIETGLNNRLAEDLKHEKLNAERLLSEKLTLNKEISKLKLELKTWQQKNDETDKLLKYTDQNLEGERENLKRIQLQNKNLTELKKENLELQKFKGNLEQQLAHLHASSKQTNDVNEDMKKIIDLMRAENQSLKEELKIAHQLPLSNALIESTNRTGKLTISGKKTRKFLISVDVPSDAENFKIKITGPDGNELLINDSNISVRLIRAEEKKSQANQPLLKRVEIAYIPTMKLTAGTYHVNVLSDAMSIGSLQVKFR